MELWLNFQESLAVVIEPNASSQESWCARVRAGESVWDGCGKERLQARRGQRSFSESRTGYRAGENHVEPGLLPKGVQQKTVGD